MIGQDSTPQHGPGGENLAPLLRTAKRLKRSLPPVHPSPSFQAGLEDELLQVARRLARSRRGAPYLVIEGEEPSNSRSHVLAGLVIGCLSALLVVLVVSRVDRRRRG